MATSASPVGTGQVLGGRYRVGPQLAAGGMADVFLGRDERLGRESRDQGVAPRPGGWLGDTSPIRCGGSTVARLAHPNVVGVYDVGDHCGNPDLIMELVAGGTLANLIAAGPLPEDVVRQVGLDILAGLGAAHTAGLLHRDVKPGNVLVAMDGTAKLADFGIAKADRRRAVAMQPLPPR